MSYAHILGTMYDIWYDMKKDKCQEDKIKNNIYRIGCIYCNYSLYHKNLEFLAAEAALYLPLWVNE